ncbi:tumor necrosis factor receptor superfamily member 10B-like [Coturnix japonica]|uniref:tumor necrosis factor receptor superfamily member 10B-like n=1 Tax=Coturnix japonica TaxID=93934 RepID=UPI0007773280|nr:tumor necrosis factor receptor superfamily member 10B-like [Coturnix japonica]
MITALRFCSVLMLLFSKVHLGSAVPVKRTLLESKKCPMGTYLANVSIGCLPCKKDEFTEYPNDFPKCLSCRTCREGMSWCVGCYQSCIREDIHPKEQLGLGVLGLEGAGCILTHCFYLPGDGGELSRKPGVVVNRLLQQLGIQDNSCNEQIYQKQQQQQQLLAPIEGSEVPRGVELEHMAPRISVPCVETQKKLVPVPGEDPITLLRRSFDTFVNVVPFPEWKRFGRALDLLENDLYLAEQHDRGSREPFYQMLNTWLNKQGDKASVNTLLETLPRIGLNGVAVRIASELIKEGYFQYEVS